MELKMVFRHYIEEDFEQIKNLFKDAFAIKSIDEKLCKTKLDKLLSSNSYMVYVASEKDKVLASCVVYIHSDPFDKDFATLWYFAVDKNYKGKGSGTNLLKFVIDDLKQYNFESLRLTTDLDNYACQKASEKAGMHKDYSYELMY